MSRRKSSPVGMVLVSLFVALLVGMGSLSHQIDFDSNGTSSGVGTLALLSLVILIISRIVRLWRSTDEEE
jgi:hypothetical protein